jgi:putative FmdB family regulatory protein
MPIYEYKCESCKKHVELLQKISDEPETKCPNCKKNKLKKLISAAGFRLKGDGWYETDFKSGNKKNLHGGEKSAGESKPGKSEKAPS